MAAKESTRINESYSSLMF